MKCFGKTTEKSYLCFLLKQKNLAEVKAYILNITALHSLMGGVSNLSCVGFPQVFQSQSEQPAETASPDGLHSGGFAVFCATWACIVFPLSHCK